MKGYVKRLLVCCICLVFSLASLGATSQSMTLRTTVPGKISLNLRLAGRGSVHIGDSIYYESTVLYLPCLSNLEVQICPEAGTAVKQILWNGEDVTGALQGEYLSLTGLGAENTLKVFFRAPKTGGENPATGDNVFLPVAFLGMEAAGVFLLLHFTRKRTNSQK